MPTRQTNAGVSSRVSSETYFPMPPVEWGRAGGSVATLTVGTESNDNGGGGGSNGTVDNKATTTDGGGSGLKVDLTISGNVCTALAVDADAAADGDGYRIGDKITVAASDSGTTTPVVGYVATLEYET